MLVTIVGSGISEIVEPIFEALAVNSIIKANTGTLGNLKTLTYSLDFSDETVISQRKKLMSELSKEMMHLVAFYEHGDWMHVYVFKRSAFK